MFIVLTELSNLHFIGTRRFYLLLFHIICDDTILITIFVQVPVIGTSHLMSGGGGEDCWFQGYGTE